MIARRTNIVSVAAPRSGQRLALLSLLLSGTGVTSGCYLTLDKEELDAKAAGFVLDAGPSDSDAGAKPAFTTALDTPAIELDEEGVTTTRDPCVATTQQARTILTTYCSECHAPPGAAGNFSSILDFPTLITLSSATAKDPVTMAPERLLIPGQPDKSRLYQRVRNGEMPPTRPPSQPQLRRPTISSLSVLRTWIQSCLATYDSASAAPAGPQ